MNIAAWSIKNNRTVTVALILIVLAGLMTFKRIAKLEDPEFIIRTAVVITQFPGASPQKVEELVTDKIEEKIREMAELDYMESESMAGMSIIKVNILDSYKDMQAVWQRLRNKVDDAQPFLPEGVIPSVVNDEFGDVFGVVFALTSDGFSYRELKDTAEDIRDEIKKIPSVAKVWFYGFQEERIYVEFSNARLAEFGASPYQISQVLATQNAIQPSGDAQVGPDRVVIESTGEFKSVEELENTVIRVPGRSEAIYLKDIAEIKRGFVEPSQPMTRSNGQQSVVLAVSMRSGFNIIEMGQQIRDTVNTIQKKLPIGLEVEWLVYSPTYVQRSISDFTVNLIEAIFFVLVVVLLFAGLRMGLIVGTLVPMAMLMCIALLPSFGVQLHSISIAALIIALGMLVDNGVVVTENILVRLQAGEERLAACTGAVKELYLPLLAATLTTVAAFSPLYLAIGSAAEYVGSLFIVVTITLTCSWILSLTMMPLLSYYFLKPKAAKEKPSELGSQKQKLEEQEFDSPLYVRYRQLLTWALSQRRKFLLIIVGLFILSLGGFSCVPKIFFPPNPREVVLIDFWLPYGSDISTTSQSTAQLEDWLLKQEGVFSVASFVGTGGPRWYLALSPEQSYNNFAFVMVNTDDQEAVAKLIPKIETYITDTFPDSRPRIYKLEMGPPVGYPIQLRVSGKDMETLYALRDKIEAIMETVPGITNIHDNWGEWSKKLNILVDQDRAKRAGLTSQDIALSLQTQYSGLESTQYREGKEIIPVEIRSQENYRQDLSKIESLNVYSYERNLSVPLSQVANTEVTWEASDIRRRNQTRTMTIKADVEGRYSSEVLKELQPKITQLTESPEWPFGYSLAYGGEIEESQKAQTKLFAPLPYSMMLLLLVLIVQFNSIRRVAIILLTLPLMMIGITPGLLLTKSAFGFMAMIGMISLLGIIVNNAIMMIDRIEIERREGKVVYDAVVHAALQRLRPILMTATTTVISLIPLAVQGGNFWRPMAVTLMAGLMFATVLTLLLCPVLYSMFFRARIPI